MSVTIIQAGTSLQMVSETGVLSTLTLPTNVSLRADVPPRFVAYGHYAVLVNTPSQPLTIDATGVVRLLCPKPPRVAPVVSGTGSGALTGTYAGIRATFVVKDTVGRVIAESDYSPASNSVAITAQLLKAANVDVSPDTISLRRLYRPLNGQSTLFPWLDIDGNVLTTAQDDTADAALSILAAPTLGTPPDLTLIAEFRDRLFGVSRTNVDTLRYTEAGVMYAWPGANGFQIPHVGEDTRGITSLISRRDALGVGKQNRLLQFTGSTDQDFRVIVLSENLGVESHDSVSVFRDTAYFLWKDGVYQWGTSTLNAPAITCLSDAGVRSWFTTDDYFNRDRFKYAFGHVDPVRNKYRLFLATAGSQFENTWVEFDLTDRTWWGPHITGELAPTSVFIRTTAAGVKMPVIGSAAGTIYAEQTTRSDGTSTPIEMHITTKRHDLSEPDLEKFWGELTISARAEAAGTLAVSASCGELSAGVTSTDTHDLTQSRGRLGRIGVGKHVQLEFTNSELGQDAQLYGYEIDPVNVVGKR